MNSLRVQPILLAALVALGAALTPYAGAQPPGFGGLFGGRDSGRGGGEGGSSSGRGRSDTSQARTAASRVVAYADQRTNSVVVRAPREVLDMIGKIVNDLDLNPAVNMTIYIFPLANADASNLATILNDLFSQLSGTTGTSNRRYSTSATSSFFSRPSTSSGRSSGSSGFGGGGSGFGGGSSGFGGGGGGSSFGRSAGGDEEWNPPPIPKDATTSRHSKASEAAGGDSAVNMGIEGSIYVVADTYTNSLLVLTDPANYERVQSIILSLDRSLPQALIKVLIAEVTHTEDWDLGAEFRGYHDKGETTQDVAGTNFNLSKETTGLVVQILDKNLEMTLRAIQEAGNLEVLSRPSILAVNNQQANITVGQEVPFVTNSRITQDGQTINTIEYQDIGIILDVTPHINDDGVVILDVYPEISALTGDTVQISDTLTAPVFAKRSATSRVVVPNQHTVVIGGLMEDKNTEDVKKVPLIGDIPYLGWLFQRKVTSKSKTELLIFLTPTVVQEYEAVSDEAAAERDKAKLLPKALGGSSFQEYMENLGAGKDGQPLRTTVSPMKHLNGSPRKEKAE